MRLTAILLLAAACKGEPAQPAAPAKSALESCVDARLAALGLNEFGDKPGTVYAGGTPLFDEKSGKSTPRLDYVLARHADLAAACPR